MRIAQVSLYYYPFMVGGAEWYVYNISKELSRLGHEVEVLTVNSYNGSKLPEEEKVNGIKVRRFPLKLDVSYRLKYWTGLKDFLLSNDYDIIHAYDYAQLHSAVAVQTARKRNARSVITVFDVHSRIPRPAYKRIPMSIIEKLLARRTLTLADGIFVRAPDLLDAVAELGADRSRLTVTPSGITSEFLDICDGSRFRSMYNIRTEHVVLYMGRLNPLKGPQFLLKAAKKILNFLQDTTFVFVGPDQSGYRAKLLQQASNYGISDKVIFTGPIFDSSLKKEAYAACDVFALPSSYEGTSQAIFEAMAQGKPVVSTLAGGIPYQVSDGVEGFLTKWGDVEQLADRITLLLRNRDLAAEMGRSGRVKALGFTYEVLALKIDSLYQAICSHQAEKLEA
ncbi:MAG: glycosyltransferase family 4 protein [Conexivisphaerales archaeon]